MARQTCCFVSIRDGLLLLQSPPAPSRQGLDIRKGPCSLGRGEGLRVPRAARPPLPGLGWAPGDVTAVLCGLFCTVRTQWPSWLTPATSVQGHDTPSIHP